MSLEFSVFFDGQFWGGVCERREAQRTRAVRVVFGSEPGGAELYDFLLVHGNELLDRPDGAAAVDSSSARPRNKPNPKRTQRDSAKAASRPTATAAAQAVLKAEHGDA